jgi:enoyl-CoA hydratase/carnithine racemase
VSDSRPTAGSDGTEAAGSPQQLTYQVSGGIATITLNRPERLNAFTQQMAEEFMSALDVVDGDDDVRAVIVTGAGRGFCAGADLSAGGATTFNRGTNAEYDPAANIDTGGLVARRIFDCFKPVIGAINGPAVGIGASITLPMDIRIAADSARFGFVFTRRGLVPESCSSWFLPRIVGISKAAEWVYSGRVFDAAEALNAGLLHSVHPDAGLLDVAHALAQSLVADSAPVAVALSRRMLWRMLGAASPAVANEIDSRGVFFLGRGPDVQEGVDAFLEKRSASFPLRVSRDLPDFVDEWLA